MARCRYCGSTGRVGDQGERFCKCTVGRRLAVQTPLRTDARHGYTIHYYDTDDTAHAATKLVNGVRAEHLDYDDGTFGSLFAVLTGRMPR